MGMNPESNEFEQLVRKQLEDRPPGSVVGRLLRPDGSPVPEHWTIFKIGEHVAIKNYTFEVAYIGKTSILFEPVGPIVVEADK